MDGLGWFSEFNNLKIDEHRAPPDFENFIIDMVDLTNIYWTHEVDGAVISPNFHRDLRQS